MSLRTRIALAYAGALCMAGLLLLVAAFTGRLPSRLGAFVRSSTYGFSLQQLVLILMVLSAVAALIWAQVSLGPLRRITVFLRELHPDGQSQRLPVRGVREWQELAGGINEMLDRLERAAADQRALFDDASHELRTPLAVVRASVEGVLTHDDVSPAARQRAADAVLRAVDRMTLLVEDLLAAARDRAGTADSQQVELAEVARAAVADFAEVAQRDGVRLTLHPGLAQVDGDAAALSRAVHNVLSNAVRVAPAGSAVEVGTGREQGWCWLAVRDHGPGIAARDQGRIFDRFWRGGDQRDEGGSGLGLAITRQLVEGHRGAVALHSSPGHGATFVLWLPPARLAGLAHGVRHPNLDPMSARP